MRQFGRCRIVDHCVNWEAVIDMVAPERKLMHSTNQTRRRFLANAGATGAVLMASGLPGAAAALPGGPVLLEARPGTAPVARA